MPLLSKTSPGIHEATNPFFNRLTYEIGHSVSPLTTSSQLRTFSRSGQKTKINHFLVQINMRLTAQNLKFLWIFSFLLLFTTQPPLVWQSLLTVEVSRSPSDTHTGKTPLDEWSSPSQRPLSTTQDTQRRHPCLGWIRTHIFSKREPTDPHFKLRGQWIWQNLKILTCKFLKNHSCRTLVCVQL